MMNSLSGLVTGNELGSLITVLMHLQLRYIVQCKEMYCVLYGCKQCACSTLIF